MMTEFLHGLYDRGQGAGLKGLWNKFRANPLFAGGFLWAYVDEALHRTDTGQMDTYGPNAPDGIVGAHREKEGSFYTVREVWSPIQISPLKITSSFKGDFYVTNEYLFSNLSECRMQWRVMRLPIPQVPDAPSCLAEGSVSLPAIQPGEKGTAHLNLPENFFDGDLLELEAYNAAGDTVCNWAFPIKDNRRYFAEYRHSQTSAVAASYQTNESSVILTANGVTATFNKANGNLMEIRNGSKVIPLSDGPLPVGMKMLFHSSYLKMQGDTALYTVKYKGAADSIVWRLTDKGLLYMDAILLNRASGGGGFDDAFMDSKVFNLGLTFSYPEKNCSGMKWMGRGPYRVWKNRIPGTNYGVWHKEYNNTITGESFENLVYPEFKGYHANMYWATLESDTTPFTIYSRNDGIFFHVFTPEEPKGRVKDTMPKFPEGDISFLLDIPAICSFKPIEQQGPNSQPGNIRIKSGDEGLHLNLMFDFRQ